MTLGLPKCGWGVGLALMTAANLAAQTVPSELGVTEKDAQESLLGSVVYDSPQLDVAARAFVALPASARVAVVQGGFVWAKAYVKSSTFRAAYEETRERVKPVAPDAEGTVEDELNRQLAEQRESLEESRAALPSLPADQRAGFEEILKQTEDQLKDSVFLGMMRDAIEMERAAAWEEYRSDLSRWEESYPANPDVLVARRLQAFLTECADVDFSAELRPKDRKMVFVNPAYEAKSANWKTCFRAGPEAMEAARAAATAWLAELPNM